MEENNIQGNNNNSKTSSNRIFNVILRPFQENTGVCWVNKFFKNRKHKNF